MPDTSESGDYLTHYLGIARYQWIFVLSIGLFIVLFILAFQPFGVTNFDPNFHITPEFLLAVASIGLVVSASLAVNEFLLRPLILRNPDRVQTIGWLVWVYLLVASVAFLQYNFLGDWHDMRWRSYFGFIRDVSMLISFPVAGFIFYIRHESLKHRFVELESIRVGTPSTTLVHLTSENEKDNVSVALSDLLYLESQDNYVAVVHTDKGIRRGTLIRSTLKRIETSLDEPMLVRCHRSFIVNLQK
ncbi:MAG: LytTR family DNA-binding domain-containing protein, partial [Woeseiaceae bacterium]